MTQAANVEPTLRNGRGGRGGRLWKSPLLWVAAALAALVVYLPHSAPLFSILFPALERPVYEQEPFAQLLWQHSALVLASSVISVLVGTLAGIGMTRASGRACR